MNMDKVIIKSFFVMIITTTQVFVINRRMTESERKKAKETCEVK
jgi:hypothetical protein